MHDIQKYRFWISIAAINAQENAQSQSLCQWLSVRKCTLIGVLAQLFYFHSSCCSLYCIYFLKNHTNTSHQGFSRQTQSFNSNTELKLLNIRKKCIIHITSQHFHYNVLSLLRHSLFALSSHNFFCGYLDLSLRHLLLLHL